MVKYAKRTTRTRKATARPSAAIVKKRKKVTTRGLKLNPVMKKLVLRAVKGREEIHSQSKQLFGNRTFDSVMAGDDIFTCAPNFGVGNQPYERTGEEVRMRSLTLYLHMRVLPTASPTQQYSNSMWLRVVVFTPKNYTNNNLVTADNRTDICNRLLSIGGVEANFNGTFQNKNLPYNHDEIQVHYSRDIKVNMWDQETYGTSTDVIRNVVTPAWFTALKIPLKVKDKKLTFSRGDVTAYPDNFNPHIGIGYVSSNGTTQPDSTFRITATCHVIYRWTDP